jgi:hypothetical protein
MHVQFLTPSGGKARINRRQNRGRDPYRIIGQRPLEYLGDLKDRSGEIRRDIHKKAHWEDGTGMGIHSHNAKEEAQELGLSRIG